MQLIQFPDKCVSYGTFVNDVASAIVHMLKQQHDDPEYVSQNKAFSMFGRANVERWRDSGRVTTRRRPGKVEYLTSELRLCQRTQQDYL